MAGDNGAGKVKAGSMQALRLFKPGAYGALAPVPGTLGGGGDGRHHHQLLQGIALIAAMAYAIALLPQAAEARSFIVYNISDASKTYFIVNGTSGTVGIGTTNPQQPLDVKGTMRFFNDGSLGYIETPSQHVAFSKKSGAYAYYFRKSNDGFLNGVGLTDLMRIEDSGNVIIPSGNVGIGIASPTGIFQVKQASNIDFLIQGPVAVSGAISLNAINDANSANIPMELRASLFDFSTGNVGIGTAVPGYKLEVRSDSDIAQFKSPTYGDGVILTYNPDGGGWFPSGTGGGIVKAIANTGNNGALGFSVRNAGSEVKAMIITNGGNVGIGTASPSATLAVNGNITFTRIGTDIVLTNTTAMNWAANTWYPILPGTTNWLQGTWVVQLRAQYDSVNYHEWIAGCIVAFTYWEASGTSTATYNCPLDTHTNGAVGNLQIKGGLNQNGMREVWINFPAALTVASGGKVEMKMKKIFDMN